MSPPAWFAIECRASIRIQAAVRGMLERDGAANVTRYTAYTMYTAKPHQPPFARETFAVDKLLYE